MRTPEAISFDLGDTLLRVDSFDPSAGTAHLMGLAHNPRGVSAEEVEALARAFDEDFIPRREDSLLEFSNLQFQRLLYERLGISFPGMSGEQVDLAFWQSSMRLHPEPGIVEVLEELRERGVRLIVISNATFGGPVLEWELERHGMLDFFEFVMSSADYLLRKPHPQLMLTAVGKLDLEPGAVWHIGDKADKDVAGARAAGLVPLLYDPKGETASEPAPAATIRHWSELISLLEDRR